MNTIKGNLIKLAQSGEFDIVIHGCNCFCTMGAGIAKQIKKAFPKAYELDKMTAKGNLDKLGTFTVAYLRNKELAIVNAYTQFGYGRNQCHADYDAIRSVFQSLANDIKEKCPNARIGYPAIGAGHAGGDWDIISKIIDKEFEGLDHTLVLL